MNLTKKKAREQAKRSLTGQDFSLRSLRYRLALPQGGVSRKGECVPLGNINNSKTDVTSTVATDPRYTYPHLSFPPSRANSSSPLPGHEATGTIAALGKNISHLPLSAPVTADPMQPCHTCHPCTHRTPLLCTSLTAYGGNVPGGFAQYCVYAASQIHLLPPSLPPLEAVLIEPAACALHGIERMRPAPGDRVLLFGSGPTGLLLAQLVRMNGAAHLTIAAKGGVKLDAARELGVADCVVAISDNNPEGDFKALLERNTHGFDVVVEATGAPSVLERSVEFVRKGGKLVVYGVYDDKVKVAWSPFTIWEKEMTILASFCSMQHMPQVLEYVRAGRLKLGGVVDRTFRIEEWGECMEVVRKGECVKAAIVFD